MWGKSGEEGAFRALSRGYTHWASGRLEQMEVNVEYPEFCHVRCYMREDWYLQSVHSTGTLWGILLQSCLQHVNVLQGMWLHGINTFGACMHVCDVIQYVHVILSLSTLNMYFLCIQEVRKLCSCICSTACSKWIKSTYPSTARAPTWYHCWYLQSVPCTSLPCKWLVPKNRKESKQEISSAIFTKHDCDKPVKRQIKLIDFDPRPAVETLKVLYQGY